MSNPPNPYNRSYNFEDFQTLNPNSPLPAQHVENELNNIEETLDATVSRLAEIQNANGSIKLTANVQQMLLNAASVEAASVANRVSVDYLAANFDSTAAASASSSANSAAQSALQSEASKVQAGVYSTAAQQYAASSYAHSVNASNSKNSAEDYADSANASKIAAHGYKLSAQNAQVGANSVYQSALQLKEGLDSNYSQLLYKREDVNHVGANMLFNGGDIDNTLIGKIFPGTSFDLNSKLVNNGPINITGLNYINGPWWVEGNAQAENPSDIVTRDMMNCLAQTWKTFGPNVARGELKALQTGVNGTPNPAWSQTDFPDTTFIKPIVYNEADFNANQSDPVDVKSAALTPKGYVDRKLINKLDFINHEVSFNNGLDNINWNINNIETLSMHYDSINLWRYPHRYFRTEITGGGIQLSSSTNGTSVLFNNEEIEFTNSTGQKTKLSSENNLLKISTGIKFPDGTTQTSASNGNSLPLTGGTLTGLLQVSSAGLKNALNENFVIDAYNDTGAGTHNLFKFNPFGGGLELPANSAGIKFGDDTVQTTAFNFTGYDYEIHVSQVDGNDTTGDGSLLKPYASITQGLTAVTSQRKTVIVHPGGYTENPSITHQYTVLTTIGQIGGNTVITGTVSTNNGCTISGLKMTNLVINTPTGKGNVNILNCDISATLSKSNNADYTLIRFCDIGTTNITSSGGVVAIFGGNPNFITVNHAGARVLVKNATTLSPVLILGNASFADTIILATTSTGNALTTSAGTIVTLANSQIVVPALNNVARVSLSGFYSIFNTVFDKPNSTLVATSATGGSTNSIDHFQQINADGITFADSTTQVTAALPVYPIVTNATIVNAKIRVIPNVPISLSANKKLSILSQEVNTFEYTNDVSNLLKSFDLTNLSIKKFVINNINKIDHITIDNCTNLKEIKIAHDGPSETMITNGININSNCNAVESLNLKSLKHLSSGALPISFTATSNLLTLSLTNLDISEVNSSWYNSSVKNLSKLTLDSLPLVHYDFITATNFPNLEYLRIGNTGDYSMPNFSLLPKLKTLIIRNWPIGNSVPQFPPSLKNVDISDSQEFDIYAMGLWGCTNMVKIRFRGVSIPSTLEDFPFGNDLQVFDFFDCNLSVGNDLGTLEIALSNINALNTSGLVNQDLAPDDARQRFKYVDFRGASNPTFTSTPASVTALRARHWIVRANGLP